MVKENNRLDENPVNWDLFARRLGRSVNVRTAISCPFSCAFCGFPQHAGKYQMMTVERVEAELDLLSKNEKVESLQFIDDTFNVPAKRFKEILRMMIDNNYKFKWHSHFRCGFADREMVELMKESGCEGVFLGIESGSDAILKNMNKAVTAEQYLKGIALLEEYGILTYGSFIIGFPGETNETVRESIAFIKESGIDFFRAQLWYCEPITPIWKHREKYGIKGSNFEWTHATMSAPEACDIIDDIFLSIDEPIWIPQYSFEFDAVFHLLHRGMTPDQVRLFIRSFNHGIRKKVKSPPGKINEISYEVIKQLRTACQGSEGAEETCDRVNVSENDAGFDF